MHSRLRYLPLAISIVVITSACHKNVPAAATTPSAPAPTREVPAPAPPSRPAPAAVQPAAPVRAASTAPAATPKTLEAYLNQLLDAYFDYNQADLRNDTVSALNRDSEALRELLRQFPDTKFVVDGNCDERGSEEYNLALGDRRAHAAREFLVQVGVPAERLTTISYGKERPTCTEHDEACWQKNRRAHLSLAR